MAKVKSQQFYVQCFDCPVEDSNCKFSHATIEREDDETTISIRMGKRKAFCSICFDTFVNLGSNMCFQCNRVVPLTTVIQCKECRRPAAELPGVRRAGTDFECPVEVAGDCEDSGLAIW